jgi:hypothetical protein
MPAVLFLLGMRFHYWSREHEPIHIHVTKGKSQAKFNIERGVELVENHGFKPHELALAEEVIKDNREYMLAHWNMYFKNKK